MIISGNLQKMRVVEGKPLQYQLQLGETVLSLNELLQQKIQLQYLGEIYCIQCARKTAKTFQQGYCFPCYRELLKCNLCTIHPEKCRYYEGNCDPNHWAHVQCGQPHVVYLANSSGLKVGITRAHTFHTRWADQGATQGLVLYRVANRYLAGIVEVALKKFIADKTDWRKMLSCENSEQDLYQHREILLENAKAVLAPCLEKYATEIILDSDAKVLQLNYPVLEYPQKVTSFNLDKTPTVSGILQGIKGQYWILDSGVISIRKFAGYRVELGVGSSPAL